MLFVMYKKSEKIQQIYHPVMKRNFTLTVQGQPSAWCRRSCALCVLTTNISNIYRVRLLKILV